MEAGTSAILMLAYAAAALLVLIHLFSSRLRFLDVTPRSVWLSLAGGVSVAYVFVHLLPELAAAQESIGEAIEGPRFLEHHVYLVALAGLVAFYGLEKMAINVRESRLDRGADDHLPVAVYWVHAGSFAIYNFLVGYLLLHREASGAASLVWFAVAMALHFLVADFGLREHYKDLYHRTGRYLLSAAVVLGLVIGQITEVPKALVAVLVGFLAGGVILNVLKEEMPKERQSRFWAFACGAGGYAFLLLFI